SWTVWISYCPAPMVTVGTLCLSNQLASRPPWRSALAGPSSGSAPPILRGGLPHALVGLDGNTLALVRSRFYRPAILVERQDLPAPRSLHPCTPVTLCPLRGPFGVLLLTAGITEVIHAVIVRTLRGSRCICSPPPST